MPVLYNSRSLCLRSMPLDFSEHAHTNLIHVYTFSRIYIFFILTYCNWMVNSHQKLKPNCQSISFRMVKVQLAPLFWHVPIHANVKRSDSSRKLIGFNLSWCDWPLDWHVYSITLFMSNISIPSVSLCVGCNLQFVGGFSCGSLKHDFYSSKENCVSWWSFFKIARRKVTVLTDVALSSSFYTSLYTSSFTFWLYNSWIVEANIYRIIISNLKIHIE